MRLAPIPKMLLWIAALALLIFALSGCSWLRPAPAKCECRIPPPPPELLRVPPPLPPLPVDLPKTST